MKSKEVLCLLFVVTIVLCGCNEKTQEDKAPLLGMEWYSASEENYDLPEDLTFLQKREKSVGEEVQIFLDYANAELMGVSCDVTLHFTDAGFVGINYHDTERNHNFREWNELLQQIYGIPTEKGNGLISWYGDPVGKNTALYLFNLQEEVQISFYTTSSTPDKAYSAKKQEDGNAFSVNAPVPEMRSQIVPDEEQEVRHTQESSSTTETAVENEVVETQLSYEEEPVPEPVILPETQEATESNTEVMINMTETAVSTTEVVAETLDVKHQDSYKQKKLEFYMEFQEAQQLMKDYTITDIYIIEEKGMPWEKVIEYSGVPYCERICDVVLSFTSLGLVGINYFNSDAESYQFWVEQLSEIYGKPTEEKTDFAGWRDPFGKKTMIYIFAYEDEIQISFYTDDSGSESVK